MADYYTKPESDALFAPMEHDHDLESLGGTELPASRVAVPDSVASDFDNAFTMDEALASIADQLGDKAETNHTHTGYAAAGHEHTGYAGTDHTHTPAAIGAAPAEHTHDYAGSNHTHTPAAIGAAPVAHTHDYAGTDHTHTPASIGAAPSEHTHTPASLGAAPSTHNHGQSDVTGLSAALEGKANTGHTHAQTDVTGLPAALAAKADLVDGKVPASQLPSFVADVVDGTLVNETTFKNTAGTAVTPESDKIYNDTDANKSYRWSGSQYVALNEGVALGETSATAYRGDRGKTAYDHSQNGDVHVTAAQKTAWDSKAAGNHTHTPAAIGAAAASHGHSYNDLSDKPTIPAAYTHPASHPASMVTGLASVATTGKYSDLSGKPTIPTIPSSLPANGGNADTLDGKHATAFAAASHNHDYAASNHTHNYAAASHKHTEHSGDITINKTGGPGINLVATATGAKTRIHKNASANADYGTIISDYSADGKRDYLTIRRSSPSMGNKLLLNMEDANGGATQIYQIYGEHNKPGVLWSGAHYMNAGQTVTPSKPLSACRSGWILMWSDFDADTGNTNDGDFCTTIIPRITPNGAAWNGKSFYCEIPRYIGSDQEDVTTESRIIKMIYIYDDKIVGHAANNKGVRTDVVLRAVYEF